MSSYKDYKKRALQNPEAKAEYDTLQSEYDIIQAMIDTRSTAKYDTKRFISQNRNLCWQI